MKKFYQTEWQGIPFASFARLSTTQLAGPEFYQSFYDEFFKRYQNWEQLSATWRMGKSRCADFILTRSGTNSTVLSIGCGLGAIEHFLRQKVPGLELFIHEVAPLAWRWIGPEFPANRKFNGPVPSSGTEVPEFDLVYLSAVDYSMDDKALTALLEAIRPLLKEEGGTCLLISASFEDAPKTIWQRVVDLARKLKAAGEELLCRMGLRSRGQFWGWTRSRDEYQALMLRAGYRDIRDGFIDPARRTHYWIQGS